MIEHSKLLKASREIQPDSVDLRRRIPATDAVGLTITQFHAGTTNNVIPEEVKIAGTLRALSETSRKLAQDGVRRVVDHVVDAHQAMATIEIEQGDPVTVNDNRAARMILDAAGAKAGISAIAMPQPTMGAEVFSYVLNQVPGAMGFLGVRPEGPGPHAACHSNRMLLDEEGMVYGTALHGAIAITMLEHGLPE